MFVIYINKIMGGGITDENSNVMSYKTYKMFAKRYKIKLSKKGKLKTMKQLANEIYDYEKNHDNIDDGLFFYMPNSNKLLIYGNM